MSELKKFINTELNQILIDKFNENETEENKPINQAKYDLLIKIKEICAKRGRY